jgi:NADPH:quinone reductase-like Zn-dependent oxidoreductase
LTEGDRTLVPFLHPSWSERIQTDAPWSRPLPPGDIHQFAMMDVNPPTAYLLLTDIVKLSRGSWVIQNGANSGVGRATVAIAKSLGLRTVNVVRRDEVIAEMKALGGGVVLVDGSDLAYRVATETGSAPITLALDGVGDTSPMNLMSCPSDGGVLASYGVRSRTPMAVQPGSLIFKKQTIRGFWLLYRSQSAKPDEITAMFGHLAPMVAAGTISTPVAGTYRFDQVREAIKKAAQSGGKVNAACERGAAHRLPYRPEFRAPWRDGRTRDFGHRSRSDQRDLCGHRQASVQAAGRHRGIEAAAVNGPLTPTLMETSDERIARPNPCRARRHGSLDRVRKRPAACRTGV